MQRFYRSISLLRAISVACLALCLWQTGAVFGQSQSQDEQTVAPPITIKLTSPVHNVCMGATLELEAEVTNVSQSDVFVDLTELARMERLFFTQAQDSDTLKIRGGRDENRICRSENCKTLKPGESVNVPLKLMLYFMLEEGEYFIYTKYILPKTETDSSSWFKRQVNSNALHIMLVNCN